MPRRISVNSAAGAQEGNRGRELRLILCGYECEPSSIREGRERDDGREDRVSSGDFEWEKSPSDHVWCPLGALTMIRLITTRNVFRIGSSANGGLIRRDRPVTVPTNKNTWPG